MDQRQSRLIRNILGGVGLLVLLIFVLMWLGVFEGKHSDEAQIRDLIDRAKLEINEHNWEDFLRLCDLTEQQRQDWLAAIPRQANYVVLETLLPTGLISVPAGATEYEQEVHTLAHLRVPVVGTRLQGDSVRGTMFFVKVDERWRIDLDRSATTFPYLPRP
jgi:hypothetical protein